MSEDDLGKECVETGEAKEMQRLTEGSEWPMRVNVLEKKKYNFLIVLFIIHF